MKRIDWYGTEHNYIHLKFGRAKKCYNFTNEFVAEWPDFAREYQAYFMDEKSKFENPFQIVAYVYKHKIPVSFYYNFTDTPAKNEKEIMAYLVNENSFVSDLTK